MLAFLSRLCFRDAVAPGRALAAANSSAAATTGVWTFLAGTYNASTNAMTLYVNGASSGTAVDATPVAANGAFTIGSAKAGGAQGDWFEGQAADIQVYPRSLSAAEVQSLYGTSNDITTSTLTTSWTRDQRGLPKTMTSPDGAVTGYTCDQAGQLTLTAAPAAVTQVYGGSPVTASPLTTAGYNTFGEPVESKDPVGDVTSYGYDADGRQVSRTMPAYTPPGGSQVTPIDTTAYDGNGLVTSVTDGLGSTTQYAYAQLGNRVTETAPDSSVTSTVYDANGEPLSVTGPTGAQARSTYDYLGRVVTSTQVERYSGSGTAAYTTGYFYGDAGGPGAGGGWLSRVASPDGVSTSYSYDAVREKTAVTDGAGNTTSYSFDGLGEQTKVAYPDGTATATGYDGAGNPVSTASLDASGNTLAGTSAAYDGEGDQVSATDAAGSSTAFTYTAGGLVTQEVQPVTATSAITTSFGYDADGKQTRYADGNGGQWWDTFNSWGLRESRVEPYTTAYATAATSTFTTGYNADQQPVTLADPGGVTVASSYSNVGELTGQSGSGADAATATRSFGYDTAGNLTSAATSNTLGSGSNATSEAFTYNDRGQVLTASGSAGSTTIGYNGDGQKASVADAAGTTSYTYDGAGRLGTLANPVTGSTATYSYNSDSLVSGISYGSGSDTRSFGYDARHRLTSDTLKNPSGTAYASISYGYNANSSITSESTTGLAGAASSTYTYDEAGRLASWNNGTATTAYGYDANGNLTTSGAKSYAYDARDEMTGDGTGTYAYTARGTPVSEPGPSGSLATTFDAYGDQATAGTRAYAYDALGRLTGDTASGAGYGFTYVGSSGAIASDGTATYAWDPSGSQLAATGPAGGGTSGVQALTDLHGNLVGQFTAAGTGLSGSRAYDPWGNVTAAAGSVSGLLGYQSGWSDPASAKVLMGARWYDPSAGDFTSADSVQVSPVPDPAAGNPFAYAADNPLDLTDPSGHRAKNPDGSDDLVAIRDSAAAYRKAAARNASAARTAHTAHLAHLAHLAVSKPAVRRKAVTALKPADKPLLSPQDIANIGAAINAGSRAAKTKQIEGWSNAANNFAMETFWIPGLDEGAGLAADFFLGMKGGNAIANGNIAGGAGDIANGIFMGAGGTILKGFGKLAGKAAPRVARAVGDAAAACGGKSFSAGTRVLLASGAAVPISALKAGDKVLATSTATGKTQPETVTAVLVHHDTDLYNLTVKTARGTAVIHTTSSHLFWDPSLNYGWIPAKHLKPGMHLKTPDGQSAVVVGGSVPAVHDGWMWDLTVPGNNDHDFYVIASPQSTSGSRHTYYVEAGATPVLVHNDGPGDPYLTSNAARLAAMRGAGLPASLQPISSTYYSAGYGQGGGYQYVYEYNNQTWLVTDNWNDLNADTAHLPHWEVGVAKPGGQRDALGRLRVSSEKAKAEYGGVCE